jgi:hypothetical protein
VPGELDHLLGQARAWDVAEHLFLVPHLVVVPQDRAEHSLPERLDGDNMLAVGQDDARERDLALVLHGIADHREGLFPGLAVRHDVVGPVEVAPVDLLDGHELGNVKRMRALDPDGLHLLGLDLDVLTLGHLVAA